MKASLLEFRFRYPIFLVILLLGFVAPWNFFLHLDGSGPNVHVWGRLAVLLSRDGALSIAAAFNAVLIAGIACAGLGAWLRTWGSAYLGVSVMRDEQMRGDRVVDDGPYRYVRNPLYLGTFVHTMALALLMPVTGAIFTLLSVAFFEVRLILAEEAFLRRKLGSPYVAYCNRASRLVPNLLPRRAASGTREGWLGAGVAEIFLWGATASFAVLGWRYDASLLVRCVMVWLGVALIARAFELKEKAAT